MTTLTRLIILLIIVDIIWTIYFIRDIHRGLTGMIRWKYYELELYSYIWIFLHTCGLIALYLII